MKYRLTPLHLLALATCIGMILEIIEVSNIKGDPGLGGLAPYIMFGLTFLVLFIDFILQLIFNKYKYLLITEICLFFVLIFLYSAIDA